MTSNQIANAANVETHRHNVESEEISKRANDIQEQRNLYEREYRAEANAITERYNEKYLEMQNAQGQRKLDLQQELNWIEWKRTSLDEQYKANMMSIAERETDIKNKSQIETERYQKALNDLGFTKNEIEAQVANLKAKQLEYDKYFRENELRIQDFEALVNKSRVDNEYSINLMRVENEQVRNELQAEMQEYQKANVILGNVWEGLGTVIKAFSSAGSR